MGGVGRVGCHGMERGGMTGRAIKKGQENGVDFLKPLKTSATRGREISIQLTTKKIREDPH